MTQGTTSKDSVLPLRDAAEGDQHFRGDPVAFTVHRIKRIKNMRRDSDYAEYPASQVEQLPRGRK